HDKSTSFPDIDLIIFDEFLTNRLYLNDEFILFMNTVSTIVRRREDVKIYMLGNTVNKYCPYFAEMGLEHIPKMTQGTIDVYAYGNSDLTVAVEYCKSPDSKVK
ncbi:phage DNA encapsidation protein, partial [Klebsiella pneumoniae]|uniref:phage DNA encapsidation protein n=2 Tax=Enterobacteriaceae TaxID=543 RepID=UPI003A84BA55